MDFVQILPTEVCQSIFNLLSTEDLWTTLYVSPGWRSVSNNDYLWRKRCLDCNIDVELERYKSETTLSDLCFHAKIWGVWRYKVLRNWEKDSYLKLKLPHIYDGSPFSIASAGDYLALFDGGKLLAFSRRNSEIVTHLEENLLDSRRSITVRALEMNKHYLVALKNSSVFVYTTHNFEPYMVINFVGGKLEITKNNISPTNLSGNSSVEFVLLHNHSLWLGEFLFLKSSVIIDLQTGKYREILFPWKCTLMKLNENVIARTDSLLAVYALSGEKNCEIKILNYSLLNTSKTVLALITDSEIHTYNRLTGQIVGQIKKSFFEFHISYKDDIIYGISPTFERSKVIIEAISLTTGDIYWSIKQFGSLTSEIKPFLGLYLWYTFFHHEYLFILDKKTGKTVQKKLLECQTEVYYVSDFFFVYQTPKGELMLRFY